MFVSEKCVINEKKLGKDGRICHNRVLDAPYLYLPRDLFATLAPLGQKEEMKGLDERGEGKGVGHGRVEK